MSKKSDILLDIIETIAGTNTKLVAANLMMSNKESKVDELAEAVNLRVKDVRKALYNLEDLELVTNRKIRDPETNWRLIIWKIKPDNIEKLKLNQTKAIEIAKQKLEYYSNNSLFICLNHEDTEISYKDAIMQNFICDSCGGELISFDTTELISKLEKNLEILESHLDDLSS